MKNRNSRSIVYRAEKSGPGKWLFALFIFIAVMTITWVEVDGFNVPTPAPDSTRVSSQNAQSTEPTGFEPANPPQEPGDPSPTPEPTTILLLGAGLGAAYLMRKKKA